VGGVARYRHVICDCYVVVRRGYYRRYETGGDGFLVKKETMHEDSNNQQSLFSAKWIWGVYVPFAVFLILALGIRTMGGFPWDIPILHFIHAHLAPRYDQAMIAITYLGELWVIIPITIIIAWFFVREQQMREAGFLLLAVAVTVILNVVLKVLFHRARPDLWPSPSPEFDYGFPSGHCMLTMALALALLVLLWWTRGRWPVLAIGGLLVLAVGFSRLYLGVHYPSDVLAAWSISMAWVLGLTLHSGERKFTVFIDRWEWCDVMEERE
jgi:undecaprenyl-diphosphatase